MNRGVLAAVAALVAFAPAGAAVHNYSYSALINGGGGDRLSGYLQYDDAAPAVDVLSNSANYNALTYLEATSPDFTYLLDARGEIGDNVQVANQAHGGNRDQILFAATHGSRITPGSAIFGIDLTLTDDTDSSWSSVALPADIALPTLTQRAITVYFASGANFQAQIDQLTAIDAIPGGVPEPATWAMMIAGFGMAGAAARKRTPAAVAQ